MLRSFLYSFLEYLGSLMSSNLHTLLSIRFNKLLNENENEISGKRMMR